MSLQLVLASPTWFRCFSGPGPETQLRPKCYVQGGSSLHGAVSLFSWFCPLPVTGVGGECVFCPGDRLHLVAHYSANVFSSLSVPVPLAKEFSLLLTLLSQNYLKRFPGPAHPAEAESSPGKFPGVFVFEQAPWVNCVLGLDTQNMVIAPGSLL